LVEEEVVNRHHWLPMKEFIDALAMGNALPGPIAVKMSGYVGFKIAGLPGAIAGAIGIMLPSLILMLVLASLFFKYKDMPQVQASLKAVRPAVV
ncbi:MAG: chromate transporter, partial [Armatimonadetes bacterium]|nr:chromate transporter [Armatimonadota bacterium]NIM23696.1 chromate transporter [Armatimonadota bacterium]NIM67573.1 chromate transporter [Armatimonadota bacterium]NIN05779.1 chromate transporter [Armatimonadota bacterium]NIO97099.1 chromate transporter [Armatimonadota bacterium]